MNKNTVIGFVLIGLIFIGFLFYQSRQVAKQMEYQAQLDSIAAAARAAQMEADSVAFALARQNDSLAAEAPSPLPLTPQVSVYKDSLLEAASDLEGECVLLKNDVFEVAFTTKGAQPLSVRLADYKTYGGDDLYIFKPGQSEMGYVVYTGERIDTKDFVFEVTALTDTSVVMRLPFAGGGYIEQKYSIEAGSYSVLNELSFINMNGVIPRNVSSYDLNWTVTIPRMEKGYKNESQYSKLDYYFDGDKKPLEIGRSRSASRRVENRLNWFAFNQQFFSAIMRAENQFSSGQLSIEFLGENNAEGNLMTCSAGMREDLQLSSAVVVQHEFYFGPNSFRGLRSYGQKYEKIIPLGGWLVGWFTRYIIIPIFNFLHRYIGNFGLIILLMTLFIKIVVLPFSYKSYASSAKMQVLKPEIEKINAKYPKQEDAMKKQQATQALYSRAGINPMGGCLPMLLQFPILWAMFRFFPASIELRQQHFLWAEDLSAYDSIIDFGTRIPLLGDHVSLFALLMAASMFFYSKMTMKNQTAGNDPTAQSMSFMSVWLMPIMMYFICNSLSAALSYYYLLSNLITMLESWIIKKYFVHPEEIMAKLKATEGKAVPKSKWQQRLEEAQKQAQQQAKNQQRRR